MSLKSGDATIDCETDFVVILPSTEKDYKTQVVIGECKTRGTITPEDVSNLRAVADAFPNRWFETFIVFSRTAGSFTDDEIALIQPLNETRRRVILFTARELEPMDVYERTHQEFDIARNASSFLKMATVTQQVFFEKRRKPRQSGEAASQR